MKLLWRLSLACTLLAAVAGQVHATPLPYANVSASLSAESTSINLSVNPADVFTVTITNSASSTEAATGISFSDTLPGGLTPTNTNPLCGPATITGQTVTWSFASLNEGASCSVQIDFTAALAGIYNDTGTFSTTSTNSSGGTTGETNTVTINVTGQLPVTTPEPGTLVLFGSGLLGVAGLIRRKVRL